MEKKKAKYLVVDATPFIQNASLFGVGEEIITISEVVAEIRNKRQLRHLASLTYDLQIRTVFPESILFVSEFSKKTGDYCCLSSTDIKLIALTYQLELEHVGRDHLRKSPVMKRYDVNARQKMKPVDSEVSYDEEEESYEDDSDEEDGSDEDDGTGWVTRTNINQLKQDLQGGRTEDKEVVVGCMSTDFAVQNVLMQLGLNVVALDGRIITQLRSYVLRCYACYKITDNMKKVFCPSCGLKTLKRVSVYIDKDGNKCININFKRAISTKGKRFSLPMPRGGKHAVNPKLVEDARRPHQKPTRLAKTKTDALEPDYIAGLSPFATRDVYSKSAQLGFNKGKPVSKYWMQRNPNESRRKPKK